MKQKRILFVVLVLLVGALTCAAFPSGDVQPAVSEDVAGAYPPPVVYPTAPVEDAYPAPPPVVPTAAPPPTAEPEPVFVMPTCPAGVEGASTCIVP